MAEGRWVNVPGKGRRWQQPSGELMMTKPGFGQGEFFQTQAGNLLGGLGSLLNSGTPRYTPEQMRALMGARLVPQTAGSSAPTDAQLRAEGYGFGAHEYDPLETGGRPSIVPSPTLPPALGGGGSPAAERAYQQFKSSVAQQTAQNPELQRYETARAAAAKSGDQAQMDSARDIGMQIWAAKHGGLAEKVKPGQSGYAAIQNQLNAGQMGAPMELGAFAGAQPTELLFNPSSPLKSAPQTGGTDYTQVVPATMPGAQGVMGSYFNNQQQAKMFSRFQQAAPAQTGMNPGLAPGSPYAQAAAAAGGASYAGATGLQPMGSSLTQGANPFASEQAQQQAEEFKKRLLSVQK